MSIRKKLSTLVLLGALTLGLNGCSDKDKAESGAASEWDRSVPYSHVKISNLDKKLLNWRIGIEEMLQLLVKENL